ncbi:hypothetical protein CEXT_245831 [Caerostris extrusa]|uniref:Secreted protein n=1 Tax=Caerostris extrusa TaxID=172846 RepID=A0AAV4WF47_CAEEX|nr:hypothetical protein CEXT_245831 [Caerostris extrusa]
MMRVYFKIIHLYAFRYLLCLTSANFLLHSPINITVYTTCRQTITLWRWALLSFCVCVPHVRIRPVPMDAAFITVHHPLCSIQGVALIHLATASNHVGPAARIDPANSSNDTLAQPLSEPLRRHFEKSSSWNW